MHTAVNVREHRASIKALMGSKNAETNLKIIKSPTQTLCSNPRLILALHRQQGTHYEQFPTATAIQLLNADLGSASPHSR